MIGDIQIKNVGSRRPVHVQFFGRQHKSRPECPYLDFGRLG